MHNFSDKKLIKQTFKKHLMQTNMKNYPAANLVCVFFIANVTCFLWNLVALIIALVLKQKMNEICFGVSLCIFGIFLLIFGLSIYKSSIISITRHFLNEIIKELTPTKNLIEPGAWLYIYCTFVLFKKYWYWCFILCLIWIILILLCYLVA